MQNSAPEPIVTPNQHRRGYWLTLIGLIVAWIGCYFPWTATRGAAFSVNLFDLAEWTSLDANVRYGSPALLPTFLLRITVGLLAIALTFHAVHSRSIPLRRILIALALLIGIGLLPPIAFFRGESSDSNYRQQFVIALITCLVIIGLWLRANRLPAAIYSRGGLVITIAVLITGGIGWLTSVTALSAFQIHLAPGFGLIIVAAGLIVAIAASYIGMNALRAAT